MLANEDFLPADVLSAFGIDSSAASIESIAGPRGINSVLRVSAEHATYVVKANRIPLDRAPDYEIVMGQGLLAAGFSGFARALLIKPGRLHGTDIVWTLYEFVPGELASASGTDRHAECGRLLGHFHRANAQLVPRQQERAGETVIDHLTASDSRISRRLRRSRFRMSEGTKSFIHGDFRADNVICAPQGLVLIDFEFARVGWSAIDLSSYRAWRGGATSFEILSRAAFTTFVTHYWREMGLEPSPPMGIDQLTWLSAAYYNRLSDLLDREKPALAGGCRRAAEAMLSELEAT
jgi:hypothetical protein